MITVLREKGNERLIGIDKVLSLEDGDRSCKTLSIEWWRNFEKMEQGISGEEIDGVKYFYCRGFSGSNEEEIIKMFDAAEQKEGAQIRI
jgi:hypothetical protein